MAVRMVSLGFGERARADRIDALAVAAEEGGRVDLADLGRRAWQVLENTARPPEPEALL